MVSAMSQLPSGAHPTEEWDSSNSSRAASPIPTYRTDADDDWLSTEEWLSEAGERHNPAPSVPAYRAYHPNGQLWWEGWYENGQGRNPSIHVPAKKVYAPNGSLVAEENRGAWLCHDPEHSYPAYRVWYEDGELISEGKCLEHPSEEERNFRKWGKGALDEH